jgi:hypothetical protein
MQVMHIILGQESKVAQKVIHPDQSWKVQVGRDIIRTDQEEVEFEVVVEVEEGEVIVINKGEEVVATKAVGFCSI